MTDPKHLDLVDRLRGQYHLRVNDGAGPLNGSMTFSREFKTPPIQHEAAAEIERLRLDARAYANVMLSEENDRLIDDNARLRAVLIDIRDAKEPRDSRAHDDADWRFTALEMKRVAGLAVADGSSSQQRQEKS